MMLILNSCLNAWCSWKSYIACCWSNIEIHLMMKQFVVQLLLLKHGRCHCILCAVARRGSKLDLRVSRIRTFTGLQTCQCSCSCRHHLSVRIFCCLCHYYRCLLNHLMLLGLRRHRPGDWLRDLGLLLLLLIVRLLLLMMHMLVIFVSLLCLLLLLLL